MNFNEAYDKVIGKLQEWLDTLIFMLPNIAAAIFIIIIFYLAARLIRNLSRRILDRISSHTSINRLIDKIIFIAVASVGFFIALGVLQLDQAVVSLLAGVGIIGLALGFAFQDMAANFMSGIAIAIRQPYKINDIIKSNDYFGTVQKINLRTTDILTPQGQIVLIPNKEVFQNPIINYSLTGKRRIDLQVGVSYGDDLEKVKAVTLNVVKDISNQDTEKDAELFYEEFGDSSINFSVRVWINYSTNKDYKKAVSEVIEKIKKAYDENDIMIPFPIRTLDFGIKGGEKLSEMMKADKDRKNGSGRE
jgi:small conductance mechanosensitive channel